jgi:hypothetical protein
MFDIMLRCIEKKNICLILNFIPMDNPSMVMFFILVTIVLLWEEHLQTKV